MKKRILLILLAALMAISQGCLCAYATEADEIAKSRKTILDSREKLKKAQEKKKQADAEKKELEKLKNDAAAYISEIDGKLQNTKEGIAALEADIAATEKAIAEVEARYNEASARTAEQRSSMMVRIRYMYENSTGDSLAALFESGSLGDFLNRMEYVRKISAYDRKKLEEYKTLVAETEQTKQELSEALSVLEGQKGLLDEEKAELTGLQEAKQKDLSEYEAKITSEENEIEKLAGDIAGIQKAIKEEENSIAAMEAAIRKREEEARKKAEAEGKTYVKKSVGSISFTWPCPASSRITSTFGSREAPVAGASTSHKGIDIGVGTGNKVLAAADGEVVIATYSASAGNYVMISHGGDVATVYMHMSEIKTSVGAEVKKGDVIGLSGNTGYSTGPHLHFGLRIDGSYVDPLGYVAP